MESCEHRNCITKDIFRNKRELKAEHRVIGKRTCYETQNQHCEKDWKNWVVKSRVQVSVPCLVQTVVVLGLALFLTRVYQLSMQEVFYFQIVMFLLQIFQQNTIQSQNLLLSITVFLKQPFLEQIIAGSFFFKIVYSLASGPHFVKGHKYSCCQSQRDEGPPLCISCQKDYHGYIYQHRTKKSEILVDLIMEVKFCVRADNFEYIKLQNCLHTYQTIHRFQQVFISDSGDKNQVCFWSGRNRNFPYCS